MLLRAGGETTHNVISMVNPEEFSEAKEQEPATKLRQGEYTWGSGQT